jgi:enoyl-CoA hydratase/carnithine racemase
MSFEFKSPYVEVRRQEKIAVLTLNRPQKRNAVCDALIEDIDRFVRSIDPKETSAVVLRGAGPHFCAGLDLAEHKDRPTFAGVLHSDFWHRTLELLEFGSVPVVAALHGAVIGGGLEIATAAHVRVAEESTFYQLPEGRRGIYVGGGASVRVQRIIGADRMREMMLTGRRYDAHDGLRLGLSHYVVPNGTGYEKAIELAQDIAGNAPISNYLMLHALMRIADMDRTSGFWVEAVATAISSTSEDARKGIEAFLRKQQVRFDQTPAGGQTPKE